MEYSCISPPPPTHTKNGHGTHRVPCLSSAVMPVVRITPPTQTVLNGTIAELVCDTTAGTPPFLFSWFLFSTEITVGVTSNATTSTLLVDTAMMQTRSRSYTCRVTLDQPLPANQLSGMDVGTLLTDCELSCHDDMQHSGLLCYQLYCCHLYKQTLHSHTNPFSTKNIRMGEGTG